MLECYLPIYGGRNYLGYINLVIVILFQCISTFTFSHLLLQFNCLLKLKTTVGLYDLITRLNCLGMEAKQNMGQQQRLSSY